MNSVFDEIKNQLLNWGSGFDRDDQTPVDQLVRRYLTAHSDNQGLLREALVSALTDAEPRLRWGAVRFFSRVEEADDGGALISALRNQEALFRDQPDPWFPENSEDLLSLLMRTIAARARADDPETLELLRSIALTPGRAGAVLASLMYRDLTWVESQAAEIVRATPMVLNAMLYNLLRRGRPVLPLAEQLGRDFPPDELRQALASELPKELLEEALVLLDSSGDGHQAGLKLS